MQKTMLKTACTFMLVLFVMSVTGAAACSGGSCSTTKVDAKNDKFNFSPSKKSGNVLSNDIGSGLKVVSVSKLKNGGKVTMKSNGSFSYTGTSCSKTGTITDSFTYKVVDKCGKYDTATVSIIYKCSR